MVRIACVGGFLGAGKTTAILAAAQELIARGRKVGIITNDQGSNLVDTALALRSGLQAEEITGGCFCCRFSEFVKHASRIVAKHNPDIILAEAVGSCTDLAATVYEPLRRFYAGRFELAPLSVFVEPARIQEILGPASQFEESVRYLFEKQVAEAELLVLSKCDMLGTPAVANCRQQIQQLAEGIPLVVMSAQTGAGLGTWVDQLMAGQSRRNREVEVDYEVYGRAEASLGWLNATVDVAAASEFSPRSFGEQLVSHLRQQCRLMQSPVAHLKVLIATADGSDRISMTTTEAAPRWDAEGTLGRVRELSAIINARVGMAPEKLQEIVAASLQDAAGAMNATATVQHMESFAPLPPAKPVLQPAG